MDYELLLIMEEVKETNEQITNQDLLDALHSLNESSVNTNNSIKELTEYLVTKDRQAEQKEATEKKQAEQEAKEQAEKDLLAEEEQASADAEAKAVEEQKEAEEQDQVQTYTETLQSIDQGVQLTNQLLAVQGIYIGIVCGLLFIKILFDRLRK